MLPSQLHQDVCRSAIPYFGRRLDPGQGALLLGQLAGDVAVYIVEPGQRPIDGLR